MSSSFALESAIDELAQKLGIDPVQLRLHNDTQTDPVTRKPFSSRRLSQCLERGAEQFGWARRTPEPGSMRLPDGTRVGWGMAAGGYAGMISPASATVRPGADATVALATTGHEMGQGLRTTVALVAAERLGVAPECIYVTVGDTAAPPQGPTGGSWGSATATPAVIAAVDDVLHQLRILAAAHGLEPHAPVEGVLRAAGLDHVTGASSSLAPGQGQDDMDLAMRGPGSFRGPEFPYFVNFSFVAHFVEVHVSPHVPRPQVTRFLSVIDCGRVLSRRTAYSQAYGGQVWGIGAALTEESEIDPRFGGFLNNNIAEYQVPVNADVRSLDVDFIDAPDMTFNPAGLKGPGEVVCVGAAALPSTWIWPPRQPPPDST